MTGEAGAVPREFSPESGRPEFVLHTVTRGRRNTPARPRRTRPSFRLQQQTARPIAFGEQQQTTAGLEIERFATRAKRADDDSARRDEPLLSRPERFFAFFGADYDQPTEIQAVLRKSHRVRRAFLGESGFLASPEERGRVPTGSQG